MKRLITTSLWVGCLAGCVGVLMTGCSAAISSHDHDYLKQANTVPAAVPPAGVRVTPAAPYYPLPGTPNANNVPPSLVPPGSRLATTAAAPANMSVVPASSVYGVPQSSVPPAASPTTAVVAAPMNAAWPRVAQALKSANYTILDQDSMMRSYYILGAPGQKPVTKSTPIYRVHLVPHNQQTVVEVLNEQNQRVSASIASDIVGRLKPYLQ